LQDDKSKTLPLMKRKDADEIVSLTISWKRPPTLGLGLRLFVFPATLLMQWFN